MAEFEGYPRSFEELRRTLRSEYDDRYVKQTSCAERHERLEHDISDMKVTHAENTTQLRNNTKLLWGTVISGVSAAIGAVGSIIVNLLSRK